MSETIVLNVTGMKCGGCESSLTNKLSVLEGVLSVQASHQQKRVEVVYEPSQIDADEIEDAIIDAGFKVED
ncbi:MAG: heavy-metal-associated domain-containing protein [Methylomonas sp.]